MNMSIKRSLDTGYFSSLDTGYMFFLAKKKFESDSTVLGKTFIQQLECETQLNFSAFVLIHPAKLSQIYNSPYF